MSPIQQRLLQMYKRSLGQMSSYEALNLSLNSEAIAEQEPFGNTKMHFQNECNVFFNYACLLELNGE